MGLKEIVIKCIPFTPSFNKLVWGSASEEQRGLFLLILLVFSISIFCLIFKATVWTTLTILGGFLLIGIYILRPKKEESTK